MPVVYLDSLTIENFGPFYGETELQFGNLDGRCGILIGGRNGAGKTHLLRALYLAVVGESGKGDLLKMDRESGATSFVLEKSLNRRAQAEGKDTTKLTITIAQKAKNKSGYRKVSFVREIRHRPKAPIVWRSYAERSDTGALIEDEQQIHKLRDGFLPRHLARFFFFDAERSQSVNLGEKDIVEGISRILGLWSYEELEADLRLLIQNKIKLNSSAAHEVDNKLADLNGQISKSVSLLNSRHKERESIEIELKETEDELYAVEDELTTLGAVDPEDLRQSQERRNEIAETKAQLEGQLSTVWEQALPLALLGPFKKTLHDNLWREEKRREWESSKATVEPKIPQIKEDVFEDVPQEYSLKEDVYSFYAERLEKALHRLFHPPPEGMAQSSPYLTERNDISAQIRALLAAQPAAIADLDARCRTLDRLNAELRELDTRLKQLQSNRFSLERGQELHERRGDLKRKREQLLKQREDLETEIKSLDEQRQELQREETNLNESRKKLRRDQSLASLASSYREVAARIREEAAVQLREQISKHVGELWTEIVERQREYCGLEFDPHWRCFLVRRDGTRQSWEEANTSAGQRQVRMLAFYEALRRLARLVPPLVVDTPLARLDKEVRASVLDRLYLSGHQSLILSTDSEIDPEGTLFRTVSDRLARVYTLNPHGEPDSSDYYVRVTSDYFGWCTMN
ncbi:MAG: AAA family ATPase [Armatimonadota bacterium]|nr:AAA family ATPase [Armatimonadota bacterium]